MEEQQKAGLQTTLRNIKGRVLVNNLSVLWPVENQQACESEEGSSHEPQAHKSALPATVTLCPPWTTKQPLLTASLCCNPAARVSRQTRAHTRSFSSESSGGCAIVHPKPVSSEWPVDKGTISVGIDATDLFDRYEEEYEDVSGSGFPQIEINKMHISQSIEAPLTATDTAILSGSLSTQNGNGGGSINFALRRVTSAKGWGELEFGAGDLQGPLFGLKLFRNLTPRCFVTTNCALQFSSRGIRPGLTTVLARNLDKNTVGYLQWRWGIQSAMNTSIVRDTKTSHFTVALQLGVPHSFALVSYQHKFQDDEQTRVKGSLKAGFFGTVVEYGAERKISRHSVLGAAVSIGVPQGVSLKVKLNRASQTYFFPIHLTDQLLPSAVFYATVGPLVVYFAMHRLVIRPYLRAQKEKELEKQRESTATDILQKKQEAEAAVRLMQESVRRIIEAEESRMGLIIVNAWYGKFVNDKSRKNEKVKVIDVTVPLQCLVKDSKLILTEASKAGLPGFYDPCVGEEKNLKVLYQFRGVLHQVMALDSEALRIPKQSHRIDTDG
ncbi:dnaJ homolog subfamily C member 11 isoform X2 [Molossus molossus]|uniref:dnaJ homolog subfamily C member 11 isoform X2 n=1 Tax=Molossus molossus TaxID=27622 RepID=UPI001745EBC4|nr:dnaJ homolog subfamily C member 11 isoform X2 [Molossus molossus]